MTLKTQRQLCYLLISLKTLEISEENIWYAIEPIRRCNALQLPDDSSWEGAHVRDASLTHTLEMVF